MDLKDIPNYENKYKISSCGKVFSVLNNKELKQSIGTTGYYRVNLNNKDGGKTFKVHRLVAICFLENPNNHKCVNHVDGNKLNNNVNNLEWCNFSHNNKHARELGLNKTITGKGNPHNKPVKRLDTGEIFYSLVHAAKSCGKYRSRCTLSLHLSGKVKSFDNTTWEFVK